MKAWLDLLTFARRPILYAILSVTVGSLVIMFLYSIISTRQLVGEVRNSQQDRASTFSLLVDCTTPTGKCFKDGQSRTGKVVDIVTARDIAAVACADEPGTQNALQIKECVNRTMKILARP